MRVPAKSPYCSYAAQFAPGAVGPPPATLLPLHPASTRPAPRATASRLVLHAGLRPTSAVIAHPSAPMLGAGGPLAPRVGSWKPLHVVGGNIRSRYDHITFTLCVQRWTFRSRSGRTMLRVAGYGGF